MPRTHITETWAYQSVYVSPKARQSALADATDYALGECQKLDALGRECYREHSRDEILSGVRDGWCGELLEEVGTIMDDWMEEAQQATAAA